MNVAQRQFLGYGKVASDIYTASEVQEISDVISFSSAAGTGPAFACKIEWMSK